MKTRTLTVFSDPPQRAGRCVRFSSSSISTAFTLIELMVVVAIIAVLASLLLPALARSKARAQALMCLNNTKHLALGWTMYSQDNNDKLAYNQGPNYGFLSGAPASAPNWVNNTLDWELTPANTNQDFINQSIIGEYVSFNAQVYHCPADNAVSDIQRSAGWRNRVRSMSMNAMVGDAGTAILNGVNLGNTNMQQFMRETDFQKPSSIFVFLDEHPDSIDDGYFLNSPDRLEWLSLPGSYHIGGSSFSFADGHSEIHRWQSASTVRPPLPGAAELPLSVDANDRADFDWVIKHTSAMQVH